jgi:hypothetical protein
MNEIRRTKLWEPGPIDGHHERKPMKQGPKKSKPDGVVSYHARKGADNWATATERGTLRLELSPVKAGEPSVIELVLTYEQLEQLQDAVAEAVRANEESA